MLTRFWSRRLKPEHTALPFQAAYFKKGDKTFNLKKATIGRGLSGRDIENGREVYNKIEKVQTETVKGFWYLLNNKILVYQDQSIVANGNVTHAKLLKIGDHLVGVHGKAIVLHRIKKLWGSSKYYKLEISGDHTYFINGILLHNASRFWVGGTGTWDAATTLHWSATSGGSSGASVPSGDSVTFDGSSGGGTATIVATNPSITTFAAGAFTGTFVGGSNTITCTGAFNISGSATRTMTLTNTTISCATWTATTTTGLTFTSTGSSITMTGSNNFNGGGLTYATVIFSTAPQPGILGSNTFTALTYTGTAAKTNFLSIGADQTITTLTLNANSSINRLLVKSGTFGTARTLTVTSLVCTNVIDFQDIVGAGAATWTTGASGASLFGDAGGNSGITTTTPATQTWNGTTGGNWSANAWSSRVPLPQDNVVLGKAWSASQTITSDMPRLGNDISWSGGSGTPTWDFSSTPNFIYGSVNNTNVGTITGTQTTTFNSRTAAKTITSAGKTFTQGITIFRSGGFGDYTLQDALITNGDLALGSGFSGAVLDAGGFTITCSTFNGGFSASTTITGAAIHLTSTAAVTIWSQTATFNTVNATGSNIIIDNASANTRTFAGGSYAYATITYTVAGSTGELDITGSNSYSALPMSDATNARIVKFTSGTTHTLSTARALDNFRGTSGKLVNANALTGASAFTFSCASGVVATDYLSLQDSTATGGATFYAGANSTSVSGNTGWIFTAPGWTAAPADTLTLTDSLTGKAYGKNPSDTITLTDSISGKAIGITKTDTITLTDAVAKNLGKLLADSLTLSDAAAKAIGKSFADVLTLTDASVRSYGKNPSDSFTLTDSPSKNIGKLLNDALFATVIYEDFESGLGSWTSAGSTITNDSIIFYAGAKSVKFDTTAGIATLVRTLQASNSTTGIYVNTRYYHTSFPTASTQILRLLTSASLIATGFKVNTTGQLVGKNADASDGSTVGTMINNAWNTIQWWYDPVTGINNASLNGGAVSTWTNSSAVGWAKIQIGTVNTCTYVNYQDEIYVGTTSQDSIVKAVGKPFSDAITLTDSMTKVTAFARAIADALTLTDAQAKAIGITKADIITLTDAFSYITAIIIPQLISLTLAGDDPTASLEGDDNNITLEGDDEGATIINEVI